MINKIIGTTTVSHLKKKMPHAKDTVVKPYAFYDPDFADFTINCGDKTFLVNKFVVGKASKVLHKMFTTDMKEKNEGIINLPEDDPVIFEMLLGHIYKSTSQYKDINVRFIKRSIVKELFTMAEKYDTQIVVEKCIQWMECSASNLFEYLPLTLMSETNDLKEMLFEKLHKDG